MFAFFSKIRKEKNTPKYKERGILSILLSFSFFDLRVRVLKTKSGIDNRNIKKKKLFF